MDTLATLVLSNCLAAFLGVAGTMYVNRSQKASTERDAFLVLQQDCVRRAEQMSRFEAQLERFDERLGKLCTDLNRIGASMREIKTVMNIAAQTGEVPRFVPGTPSGEGERV